MRKKSSRICIYWPAIDYASNGLTCPLLVSLWLILLPSSALTYNACHMVAHCCWDQAGKIHCKGLSYAYSPWSHFSERWKCSNTNKTTMKLQRNGLFVWYFFRGWGGKVGWPLKRHSSTRGMKREIHCYHSDAPCWLGTTPFCLATTPSRGLVGEGCKGHRWRRAAELWRWRTLSISPSYPVIVSFNRWINEYREWVTILSIRNDYFYLAHFSTPIWR